MTGGLALHGLLPWLAALSVVMFLGSLLLIPLLVVRLPDDYLVRDGPPLARWQGRHPAIRLALLVAKNLCGAVLLALGLVMALPFMPGQGILAIVAGLMLVDLPGKRALERRIIGYPPMLRAINGLRARRGRPPIRLPPS